MKHSRDNSVTLAQWVLAAIVGLGLATGVWWGLVTGGGLVGGDTYPYFMPQKIVLADSLAAGELPLWHHLTGLGYPLHAESQAGVFYPTNQILYRCFDVNRAYSLSIILHYWLAFVFAWRFARAESLSTWPALLAALVFVYGWFPARVSLEWSIIGGVWLPLTLWQTRSLIENPNRRRFVILAVCLGTHLLAGHFALAFINQLTVVLYAWLRLWIGRHDQGTEIAPAGKAMLLPVVAIFAALALAAIQVAPTYELKQVSQREGGDGKAFSTGYGHMPPVYATQLVASWWYWHSPEVTRARELLRTPGAINADTNSVEAHLYWGLIPLCLVLCMLSGRMRSRLDGAVWKVWTLLMAMGLLYATGWLLPVTRHLPGFSFFMGPGRYTIVSALAGAILSGLVLDNLLRKASQGRTVVVTVLIGSVTLVDLLWSSRYIADAVVTSNPAAAQIDQSWVRSVLSERPFESRLLAPGPNVGNLFGVSCIPQYLGLGPAIYYDEFLRPKTGPDSPDELYPDDDTHQQLQQLGVTHVLTTEPISQPSDHIHLLDDRPDAYLNTVWGRGMQPCYLYEVLPRAARIETTPASALSNFELTETAARTLAFSITLTEEADVILKELMFPGWQVTIDDQPTTPVSGAHSMRAVRVGKGTHDVRWTYRPNSFRTGLAMTLAAAVFLTILFFYFPARSRAIDLPNQDPSKKSATA